MSGSETSDGTKVKPMTRGSQDSQGPPVKSGDGTMVCRSSSDARMYIVICENTMGDDTLCWMDGWMDGYIHTFTVRFIRRDLESVCLGHSLGDISHGFEEVSSMSPALWEDEYLSIPTL